MRNTDILIQCILIYTYIGKYNLNTYIHKDTKRSEILRYAGSIHT